MQLGDRKFNSDKMKALRCQNGKNRKKIKDTGRRSKTVNRAANKNEGNYSSFKHRSDVVRERDLKGG